MKRRYLIAVALLAILTVMFGLAGTIMPVPLPPQQSSSDSVAHFANPPTWDSGWVDIRDKGGKYVTLSHGLNTTEVYVDVTGKRALDPIGGALEWSRTYGGAGIDYAYSVVQTSDGGYALAGRTNSDPVGGWNFRLAKTDWYGNVQWNKSYGGANSDYAYSVVQTSDGGYALAGQTNSFGASGFDGLLVKIDSSGDVQWSETYGGATNDNTRSVVQVGDGYMLAGYTNSFSAGDYDFWLVRTDSTGNHLWNKTYGGTDDDYGYSLIQTSDGGYALAGWTYSFGPNTPTKPNFWLVKTGSDGFVQWNKTYGGTGQEFAYSAVQTSDGGYILAGSTDGFGAAGTDVLLVKTDSDGDEQWLDIYGGTGSDAAFSVVQASDGGYALAGYTYSYGGGNSDFWLVKTDTNRAVQWSQAYGGPGADFGRAMIQTSNGGYALVGYTHSFGAGSADWWLVKVGGEMNIEHQRNLGGTFTVPTWSNIYENSTQPHAVVQTYDGGYAMAGYKYRYPDSGNFTLTRIDSNGNMLWSRSYGGPGEERAFSVVQAVDGGYAIAGYTNSSGAGDFDLWLVKTDFEGNMQWSQTYGGAEDDMAFSIVRTNDCGYVMAGYTDSWLPYGFYLVKTDALGDIQWAKSYDVGIGDKARAVIQTSDGGYAVTGYSGTDFCLAKMDSEGTMLWSNTYGGGSTEKPWSLVEDREGGYVIAGYTHSFGAGKGDFWLVKTDADGNMEWSRTYGGEERDVAYSVVQTFDGGYAVAGCTKSFGAGGTDYYLVKTDSSGYMQWSQTYGLTSVHAEGRTAALYEDFGLSIVQTNDGAYAIPATRDYLAFAGGELYPLPMWYHGPCLIKTDAELGLATTGLTNQAITLYRGRTDPDWNYVRVRIWTIKEPTWLLGDLDMDGDVDAHDLYILSRNYGKTFSLLSLTGILAVAGIHQYKKRKHPT